MSTIELEKVTKKNSDEPTFWHFENEARPGFAFCGTKLKGIVGEEAWTSDCIVCNDLAYGGSS